MNIEKPVKSPCVHICALDDDDVCTGCQRSMSEIVRWSRMENEERRQVLVLCDQRAREKGLML
ncbi:MULTISPECIES: DUF1289 domain-containing protein [Pseudomonas]|jgi:predicted Fe-S protein YdhL (DUF1289 family)|uniref:Fe-S protein n=1 Tax=Pseudomonas marincola TaxID=437900 RepID=A0A1I6YS07_9PSED|nr:MULTISPECIES: DUF1289 domain-containing protein [Pseudomonas]NRH28816.1 DUF1289 domain-containing protein [Pseudomonas sp. MS19]OEO26814.1 Fe-S protein [Pseudomonas sp. J237]CAE6936215.1 Fe-S protein [Pseudomonas marincola]SFT53194.1 hypothetical protein SAMN05216264_101797 [Pseudomonas marincola]